MANRARATSRDDVARLAGVAPATVSLVLNGKGDSVRVAKATQERVREAAQRLRYVPNSAARAWRGQRHLTIGLITRRPPATLHVPVFEDFAVGAIEQAAAHRHSVKFLPPVTEDDTYDVVATLQDAQVDGIVVHTLDWVVRSLVDWKVPVVYVGLGEEPDDLPLDRVGAVTVDEMGGLRAAAAHLLERGHQRVGVISGLNHRSGEVPRLQAFAEEFTAGAGPEGVLEHVTAPQWSPDGGYQATRELLERATVTALHAGNDWMAIGALRAIREAGLRVPDDIHVVGFGDFRGSAYLSPPLTTVTWPLGDLGVRAVDLLMAQLDGPEGFGHVVAPADLVVRESTAGRVAP